MLFIGAASTDAFVNNKITLTAKCGATAGAQRSYPGLCPIVNVCLT
jgi:hypothetical protein